MFCFSRLKNLAVSQNLRGFPLLFGRQANGLYHTKPADGGVVLESRKDKLENFWQNLE